MPQGIVEFHDKREGGVSNFVSTFTLPFMKSSQEGYVGRHYQSLSNPRPSPYISRFTQTSSAPSKDSKRSGVQPL